MCVASIAWNAHPRWRLVVIGNRDEYHDRPTAPLARWSTDGIIAGRDLKSGGTWLGVSEAGRFALVTNFRVPGYPQPDRPSRGALVTDLLTGSGTYGEPETAPIAAFNPFNLFHASDGHARVLVNHPEEHRDTLPDGIHGLSNGPFEGSWPKTRQLNAALAEWLAAGTEDFAKLFVALRQETPHPHDVPANPPPGTQPEPRFAPVFIRNPIYGTRCSTVVAINREGRGTIIERSFSPTGDMTGEIGLTFAWPD